MLRMWHIRGIKMGPGTGKIRTAAVSALMDVHGKDAAFVDRKPLNGGYHQSSVPYGIKLHRTPKHRRFPAPSDPDNRSGPF